MTALAEAFARAPYLAVDALPDPYGPDAAVFGAPRPRHTADEAEALHCAAGLAVYYACCGTRGTGPSCWHCGRHGQIAPEPARTESADPVQVVTSRGEPAMSPP